MPNDHLKTAISQAGLTAEQFADIISVDPKTVQRWIAGRTPYARHRATISRALDLAEHELWPDSIPAPTPPSLSLPAAAGAVTGIQGWSSTDADGAPSPIALITDDVSEVDLLDPWETLLHAPGMLAALQTLAGRGCRLRVLVCDPEAESTDRDIAEQIGIRIFQNGPYDLVLLRADDTLLMITALGEDPNPPLFAIHRNTAEDLFNRLVDYIDEISEQSIPLPRYPDLPPYPDNTDDDDEADDIDEAEDYETDDDEDDVDRFDDGEPARRWPRRPT